MTLCCPLFPLPLPSSFADEEKKKKKKEHGATRLLSKKSSPSKRVFPRLNPLTSLSPSFT